MVNEDYWNKELNSALEDENITNPSFFEFMRGKIKTLALPADEFGWGVFPLIDDDGIVYDIRMVVPVINDTKTLCINIHEYTHAYEVYESLGEVYVWHEEISEQKAREAEQRYLMKKK